METRMAIIGIFVYNRDSADRINDLLHEYRQYIIGRMGLPYREKEVSVITVVVDAPEMEIGALSGKLGMVRDVQVKTAYSKL